MHNFKLQTEQNKDRRSLKTAYVLPDTLADDGSVAVLEVTTYHFGNAKTFSSGVQRTRTKKDGYFTVSTYDLMEPKPVANVRVPVARYSFKALEAAHEAYLAKVALDLPPLLEWASHKAVG